MTLHIMNSEKNKRLYQTLQLVEKPLVFRQLSVLYALPCSSLRSKLRKTARCGLRGQSPSRPHIIV